MPCLLLIIGAAFPRILMLVLWFFTGWFRAGFDTLLWPLLGFFFMPLTTVWFGVVQYYWSGEWSLWPIIGMVIALAYDLGLTGSEAKRRSKS